jgi:EAL domain-containing protein (putative c-di-GMP-specific phosphodiesterase class I)
VTGYANADLDADEDAQVMRLLQTARTRLGMSMSWISRISDGRQTVENVDGDAEHFGVTVGDSSDYETSYCFGVLGGQRAGVVTDAKGDPRTRDLPITAAMGIGAYVGAPIRLPDGTVYGMLCCFSSQAEPALQERDAQFLAVFAELLTDTVQRRNERHSRHDAVRARITEVLRAGGPNMVYQAVYRLPELTVIGYEALARFPPGFGGPDTWFADATAADPALGLTLELAAVRNALNDLPRLPAGAMLGVNASPTVVKEDALFALIACCSDPGRVMVEVTEHERVTDYPALTVATDRFRALGIRIVADDTGAGYAGLQHLVELRPDDIKIDISIVHGIDHDPARAAIAHALADFAAATDTALLAEGVETAAELQCVIELGVTRGQGYFLHTPQPIEQIVEAHARSLQHPPTTPPRLRIAG